MSLAVDDHLVGAKSADARPCAGRARRTRLWREAVVLGWLLWLYDAVNSLSAIHLHAALAHASSIFRAERWLHLDPEVALNRWIGANRLVGFILSNFYDDAHFVVTLGLLGWLWWRHPPIYRPLRNTLVFTNVIGFAVFWLYPVAPPRMLSGTGFLDVVAITHSWGAWHSGALASSANELAAMPSLHIAWALWCSVAMWLIARRSALRILAVIYPVVTTVVVLGTANHFFFDVVGGAMTLVVAGAGAWAWQRWRGPAAVRA
jgi:hypothetical protein